MAEARSIHSFFLTAPNQHRPFCDLAGRTAQPCPSPALCALFPHPLQNRVPRGERAPVALCCEPTEAAAETKSFCPCHLKFGLIPGFPGFKPFSLLYENHYYDIIAAKNARKTAKNRKIQHEIQHGLHTKTTRFYAGFGCPLSKRQLQQRSRQKGTATQERWLFPFSCKRKVTAKKDGEKTPREANPHWAP